LRPDNEKKKKNHPYSRGKYRQQTSTSKEEKKKRGERDGKRVARARITSQDAVKPPE